MSLFRNLFELELILGILRTKEGLYDSLLEVFQVDPVLLPEVSLPLKEIANEKVKMKDFYVLQHLKLKLHFVFNRLDALWEKNFLKTKLTCRICEKRFLLESFSGHIERCRKLKKQELKIVQTSVELIARIKQFEILRKKVQMRVKLHARSGSVDHHKDPNSSHGDASKSNIRNGAIAKPERELILRLSKLSHSFKIYSKNLKIEVLHGTTDLFVREMIKEIVGTQIDSGYYSHIYKELFNHLEIILKLVEVRLAALNSLNSELRDRNYSHLGLRESLTYIGDNGKRYFKNYIALAIDRMERLNHILKADNLNNVPKIFDEDDDCSENSSTLSKATLGDLEAEFENASLRKGFTQMVQKQNNTKVKISRPSTPITSPGKEGRASLLALRPDERVLFLKQTTKDLALAISMMRDNSPAEKLDLINHSLHSEEQTVPSLRSNHRRPISRYSGGSKMSRDSKNVLVIFRDSDALMDFNGDERIYFERLYDRMIAEDNRSARFIKTSSCLQSKVSTKTNESSQLKRATSRASPGLSLTLRVSRTVFKFKKIVHDIVSKRRIELEALDDDRLTASDNGAYFTQAKDIVYSAFSVELSDYSYICLLGKGGYGRVYLVRRKNTGDLYALKVINCAHNLPRDKLQQIINERNVFGMVRGDLVLHAISTFVHGQFVCFLMDFISGGSLEDLLKRDGALAEEDVRFYAAQVVAGLELLHKNQIIHRDVKPANIMINDKGKVQLADFGLSDINTSLKKTALYKPLTSYLPTSVKLLQSLKGADDPNSEEYIRQLKATNAQPQKSEESNQKKKYMIVGTPDYMSPEIINGEPATFAADFWALGVVIYELLTEIPPFNDSTVDKVFENIIENRMEWPRVAQSPDDEEGGISPELNDLLHKLLEPNPIKRINAADIKKHSWFAGINWSKVEQLEPPYIPPSFVPPEVVGSDAVIDHIEEDFSLCYKGSPTRQAMAHHNKGAFVDLNSNQTNEQLLMLNQGNNCKFDYMKIEMMDKINRETLTSLT